VARARGVIRALAVLEQPFAAGQTLRVLTNWEKRLTR
jgi:hypothetical protein